MRLAINVGKVSKNQTAAQRAIAQEVLSGKRCSQCGQEVKLKDLVNVKQVDHASGRTITAAYHRKCYGF